MSIFGIASGYSVFLISFLLSTVFLLLIAAWAGWLRSHLFRPWPMLLLLISQLGFLLLAVWDELPWLILGLELSFLPLCVVAAILQPDQQSREAALKGFFPGLISTAFVLFGFALLFVASGTSDLIGLFEATPQSALSFSGPVLLRLGGILLLSGLASKLALVPFHLWFPDLCEGAPTVISGIFLTSFRVLISLILLRIFACRGWLVRDVLVPAMAVIGSLSVLAGAVMLLVQTNLKRILAWVALVQSGFLAIMLSAAGGGHIRMMEPVFFCILTSAMPFLLICLALMGLESSEKKQIHVGDLKGLASAQPFVAFTLMLALFSLAGLPPTAAFLNRFLLLQFALDAGYLFPVALVIFASILLFCCSLRIAAHMYSGQAEPSLQQHRFPEFLKATLALVLCLMCLGVVFFPKTLLPDLLTPEGAPLSDSSLPVGIP